MGLREDLEEAARLLAHVHADSRDEAGAIAARLRSHATSVEEREAGHALTSERLREAMRHLYENRDEMQRLNLEVGDRNTKLAAVATELSALRVKLGEAVALMTEYVPDSHYAHFDREGNAGATCPACITRREHNERMREFKRTLETP